MATLKNSSETQRSVALHSAQLPARAGISREARTQLNALLQQGKGVLTQKGVNAVVRVDPECPDLAVIDLTTTSGFAGLIIDPKSGAVRKIYLGFLDQSALKILEGLLQTRPHAPTTTAARSPFGSSPLAAARMPKARIDETN